MIILTDEEKAKIKSGEWKYEDVIKARGQEVKTESGTVEIPSPDTLQKKPNTELDKIKQELRDTNTLYREAIEENRRLRDALKENVQLKATLRQQIETLRKGKKELMR